MSRQSEFKKRFDPEMGKYTVQHIYGTGVITDTFKNMGSKLFKKKATKKALATTSKKTGEYVGKKAGDKIVSILSKEKKPKSKKVNFSNNVKIYPKNTRKEINEKVNSILSGGKII